MGDGITEPNTILQDILGMRELVMSLQVVFHDTYMTNACSYFKGAEGDRLWSSIVGKWFLFRQHHRC
jgi:hypothetical protein